MRILLPLILSMLLLRIPSPPIASQHTINLLLRQRTGIGRNRFLEFLKISIGSPCGVFCVVDSYFSHTSILPRNRLHYFKRKNSMTRFESIGQCFLLGIKEEK